MRDVIKSRKLERAQCLTYPSLPIFRILVCGEGAVGKSTFLIRVLKSFFEPEYFVTKNFDLVFCSHDFMGERYFFQYIDLAGQREFQLGFESSYFLMGIHGVLFFFDVTNGESLSNATIERWMPIISYYSKFYIPKILVGNKIDLLDQRIISHDEAKRVADRLGMYYIETSVKDDQNVNDMVSLMLWSALSPRIVNLEKLKETNDYYGILTEHPTALHDSLYEHYTRFKQALSTSEETRFKAIKDVLPLSLIAAKSFHEIYRNKHELFAELRTINNELSSVLIDFLYGGTYNRERVHKAKYSIEKLREKAKNFSKDLPKEIEDLDIRSQINEKWGEIRQDLSKMAVGYVKTFKKYHSDIEKLYSEVEQKKENLELNIKNRIKDANKMINDHLNDEARVEIELLSSNFKNGLEEMRLKFINQFLQLSQSLNVSDRKGLRIVLNSLFNLYEASFKVEIERINLISLERIQKEQQKAEILNTIQDFISQLIEMHEKLKDDIKKALERDLDFRTIMNIGINKYSVFFQKFNEFRHLLETRIRNTDLDDNEKQMFSDDWTKGNSRFFHTIQTDNEFFIRMNGFFDELENFEDKLKRLTSPDAIRHFNVKRYHDNLSKLKEMARDLDHRESDIKHWISMNITRLTLNDFQTDQALFEKMQEWSSKFINLLKKRQRIEDQVYNVYYQIHKSALDVVGDLQFTDKMISFQDFRERFLINIRPHFLPQRIDGRQFPNKQIIETFRFLKNNNEIDGILNERHHYFEFRPFQSIAPSITRM